MSSYALSWFGAIVSLVGTVITIWQAWKAKKAKNAVEKYKDDILSHVQTKSFSTLVEKGKKTKDLLNSFSSKKKNSKTSRGLNDTKVRDEACDFITSVNESLHLIDDPTVENLLLDCKKHLSNSQYDDLIYCFSDVISILEKKNDSRLTQTY